MSEEVKQGENIAPEIDDLFLQLIEMLWTHVSICYSVNEKKSFNITEYFIIEYLGKESFVSMSKLSKIIHVAPTTMTSIVDRLIKRGLLQRRSAQHDRRKVLVTLSEEGRQFYSIYHHRSTKIYANFLSKLPDSGKTFNQSLREIKKSIFYLKKHFKES